MEKRNPPKSKCEQYSQCFLHKGIKYLKYLRENSAVDDTCKYENFSLRAKCFAFDVEIF